MLQLIKANEPQRYPNTDFWFVQVAPDLSRVFELNESNRSETLEFLAIRPVHTVVMASFIADNGIESLLNRGKFYGYRNAQGTLEGIALIGHTTLVEARTEEALKALALTARSSETPIHVIMSDGTAAESFWNYFSDGLTQPRLKCTEMLFEISFPFMVRNCKQEIRPAKADELLPVAEAQAEIAFTESGVDPMQKDREGFLKRVARRIEQGRVFVVFENDKLVFKADIIAETTNVIYLEGIYVAPECRGQGVGSDCLAKLSLDLMNRVENICFLSNFEFKKAHQSFNKAGYKNTGNCTTLFV
ncbi:MAG: GNAT family N-acetyltransferase [Pyrinomonadaceae bacterium]